jgi:hypothetical protein
MKYTVEYCKKPENKVVIHVKTPEEVRRCDELLDNNKAHSYLYTSLDYKDNNECIKASNYEHSELSWYKRNNYDVISFEQFMEDNKQNTMERKIIGYKSPYDLFSGQIKKDEILIKTNMHSYCTEKYKDSSSLFVPKEIVEQWEAVYEEEFKVGDYITVVKNSNKNAYNGEKGKTYKIIRINGYGNLHYSKDMSIDIQKVTVRKATPEEIKAATERYVTLSNGKEVRINKEGVLAEGKLIPINSLESLLKPFLSTVGGWSTELIDATYKIGCWEEVKKADIELIIKNYNELV